MREHLKTFIEAVQADVKCDNPTYFFVEGGIYKIGFGYGYHDLSKVIVYNVNSNIQEVLTVDQALDKLFNV